MVSMMILLTVLILLSCRGGVDGRTWRPSTGTPPSILLQRNRRQPSSAAFFKTSYDTVAFLRGGETDNFQSCSPFNGLSRDGDSNCNTSGARGGSTTPQLVNTLSTIHDLSSITATSSDASISTLPSSSSSTTDLLEDSSTSSSSSFEQTKSIETVVVDHGGAYLISEEISNEVTNDKNGTAKTPSDIKAAFKELKLQRKKEKEQRKRHKQIAKSLRNRNAVNKRRKFMHATWGLLFATLNHVIPRATFVPAMTIVTTGTLVLELLRYRKGFEWMNEGLHKVLGHALRKNEMDGRFTGSFYYFLGVTITAMLYPTSCATLGICQLAIADPTASYFGRATRHIYWSRIGNGLGGVGRNKGFFGFLGGALACVPLNYRLLSLAQFTDASIASRSTIFLASLALGAAGAFADLIVPTPALTLPKTVCGVRVPPFHVDDNFIVPVVSGWACVQIFKACQWPSNLALAAHLIVR